MSATAAASGLPEEGFITAILGPTNSGKTRCLTDECQRIPVGVLFIAPRLHPSADASSSPPSIQLEKNGVQVTLVNSITEVYQLATAFNTLIADDAHLIPDFSDGALSLARIGKNIVFSALIATNEGVAWPSVARVIPLSDECIRLKRQCDHCKIRIAFFSYHITGVSRPLCRGCYRTIKAQESPVISPASASGPGSPVRKLSAGAASATGPRN